MEDLVLTQEETQLVITRRRLFAERQKRHDSAPKNAVQQNSLTNHTDPDRVHLGRLNEDHPLGWFEPEIFRKISNTEHQGEHKKITSLLKMPIQTKSRDRTYHCLVHLDVLWTEKLLPLHYKRKYEEYKKEHRIGEDNIHPKHKEVGINYRLPQNKRVWDEKIYEGIKSNEKFIVGKIYEYAPDKAMHSL